MTDTDEHDAALVRFRGGEFCTDCGHVTAPPPGAHTDAWAWWLTPEGVPNLETMAMVLHWMAEEDYRPRDMAYAVEKPWKFTEEFLKTVDDLCPGPGPDEEDTEPQRLLAPAPEPDEEQAPDLLQALVLSIDRHRAGRPPKG